MHNDQQTSVATTMRAFAFVNWRFCLTSTGLQSCSATACFPCFFIAFIMLWIECTTMQLLPNGDAILHYAKWRSLRLTLSVDSFIASMFNLVLSSLVEVDGSKQTYNLRFESPRIGWTALTVMRSWSWRVVASVDTRLWYDRCHCMQLSLQQCSIIWQHIVSYNFICLIRLPWNRGNIWVRSACLCQLHRRRFWVSQALGQARFTLHVNRGGFVLPFKKAHNKGGWR